MNGPTVRCDVAIVGAGIAGSALAALLGRLGLEVLLLDGAATPAALPVLATDIAAVDPRVSALSPASRRLLAEIGAWESIPLPARCDYQTMRVWEQDGTGAISFDAAEIGAAELGAIVENRWILAALMQALRAMPDVGIRGDERLEALRLPREAGDAVELDFASGLGVRTRLLVGADGAQSAVRRLCGIEAAEEDTGQRAIVATIRTAGSHADTAWQCFLPSGPLAVLPLATLPGGQASSIVWSADEPVARELLALDDAVFADCLSEASERCAGEVLAVTPRRAFPLRQLHARRYTDRGAVLIGDAAHVIHPLAGQGINLGLSDARVLAEEIARALQRGETPDAASALARYSRRRRGDNAAMLAAMRGFQQLFGAREPALRLARNLGLGAVGRFVPLKRAFMRQAMGL
jgi:2-octaprenylphenol hydroxylase